ncbi:MAG: hypothetical protein KF691_00015 [Phycisphaeraceae bacterium]|nr:hypothetical protein [Phycisphaeraceae bacterium]
MPNIARITRTPLLPLVLPLLLCAASPAAIVTVTNTIYDAHVETASSIGSWNAITGTAHTTGAGNDLTYRGSFTGTNYSSLRVYTSTGTLKKDYSFRGSGGGTNLDPFVIAQGTSPASIVATGKGYRTQWRIPAEGLEITQDVIVVPIGLPTTANSAIYHTVEIKNIGSSTARVGWRNLYDWDMTRPNGSLDDGPGNQLDAGCPLTTIVPFTGTEFSHKPVTADIARVRLSGTHNYEVLLALKFDPGFIPSLPVTVPDEYCFASWPSSYNAVFNYVPSAQTPADTAGLSWFGRDFAHALVIGAGQSRRLTQIWTISTPGDCFPGPRCLNPPNNMALWLPFDQLNSLGVTRNVVSGYGGVVRPSVALGPALSFGSYVNNCLYFNGVNQYVSVMNHSLVDIAEGDLSIDAWVFVTEDTNSSFFVLTDKRRQSGASTVGYLTFLVRGAAGYQFGIQLADGGANSWISPTLFHTGWHHLAVTVARKLTNGGTFYIDGTFAGNFNPTGRQGSLSNISAFNVGAAPATLGGYFFGFIDEVEVFRRVLPPTEVFDIYNAKMLGKCKQFVQAYPDTIFCGSSTTTTVGAYLFNFAATGATFTGNFGPTNSCGTPLFPTAVAFPPTFVGSGITVPVWMTATKPASLTTTGSTTCYLVTATQPVPTTSSTGKVTYRPDIACSNGIATLAVQVPLGGSTNVAFHIGNESIKSAFLRYRIEAIGPDGLVSQYLALNGLLPGEPVEDEASVPLGSEIEIIVEASFREVDALGLTFLRLSTDTDGDGIYEPADIVPLACQLPPACCIADFNCDGQVDDGDFAIFAPAYDEVLCADPDICPTDLTADGVVDDQDFQIFILAYSGVECT